MTRWVPCARATRRLRKPSLDARSGGLIRAIQGNVNNQDWQDHLSSLGCGLAWDEARLWAKRLSWQTQGGRVK